MSPRSAYGLGGISADGRYVAFGSYAGNLVPGDTNDHADVFVLDQATDTVRRASLAADGAQGNGGSLLPSISANGCVVAFASYASNLVPDDTNEVNDIFVVANPAAWVPGEHKVVAFGGLVVENVDFGNRVSNRDPVADADGPYVIGEDDDLVLDASGSYDPDAGDSIASYAWDLDNDGQYDDLVTTDAVATVPYGTLQTLGLGLGTYPIGLQVTDTHTATGTDFTTVKIVIPPSVEGVLVNDGSAQRSMITSLTVSFDRAISVEAGAFELVRRDGLTVPVSVALSADATDAVLSFAGWLEDGVYDLTVRRDYVHDLDGVRLATDHLFTFHRLYGDSDGDRDVDGVDLVAFRGTYGLIEGVAGYLWYFDSDGDDDVDYDDYYAFRANYRKLLTY